MSETSASFLDRLRSNPDASAWQRLFDLYSPLIRAWLRRHSTLEQDADDLVQEVMTVVFRKLPEFRREPRTGAFRRWLRSITVNCLRAYWRSRRARSTPTGDREFLETLDQLEDPHSDLSRLWDEEHDRHVTRRLLEFIRVNFEPSTWRAFERVTLHGVSADQAARELGMSVNAIYIVRSRVMTLLRQEGAGLID